MMWHRFNDFMDNVGVPFVIAALGGIGIGTTIGGCINEGLKQEAIKRGFAEYNQATGQWQWKEPVPQKGGAEWTP